MYYEHTFTITKTEDGDEDIGTILELMKEDSIVDFKYKDVSYTITKREDDYDDDDEIFGFEIRGKTTKYERVSEGYIIDYFDKIK